MKKINSAGIARFYLLVGLVWNGTMLAMCERIEKLFFVRQIENAFLNCFNEGIINNTSAMLKYECSSLKDDQKDQVCKDITDAYRQQRTVILDTYIKNKKNCRHAFIERIQKIDDLVKHFRQILYAKQETQL